MKINTTFKDYYDSAIPIFKDSDYTWVRKREKLIVPMNEKNDLLYFPEYCKVSNPNITISKDDLNLYEKNSSLNVYMIGICGQWYYGALQEKIYNQEKDDKYSHIRIYTSDTRQLGDDKENKTIKCEPYWKISKDSVDTEDTKFIFMNWINWEDTNVAQKPEFKFESTGINPMTKKWWTEDIFNIYGPILFVERMERSAYPLMKNYKYTDKDYYVIYTYPDLKKLRFCKIMDAYTLMFKLDQYFNNIAIPDEAIVPVGDDITRLEAYGFDKKTSFRKGKEK